MYRRVNKRNSNLDRDKIIQCLLNNKDYFRLQIVNKLNAKTYIYLIIKNNIDFSICITPKVPVMGNLFYLTDYLIP